METFFEEAREGMGNSTEGGSQKRGTGEMHQLGKIRKDREKKRSTSRRSEPFEDPLLQRLMMGDWAAMGEMAEGIKKDEELVREVTAILQGLKERANGIRTDGEVKREAGNLQGAKKKVGKTKRTCAEKR